jgi:hypothetical protein
MLKLDLHLNSPSHLDHRTRITPAPTTINAATMLVKPTSVNESGLDGALAAAPSDVEAGLGASEVDDEVSVET